MDLYLLNRLVEKVSSIKNHLNTNDSDPLLQESLQYYMSQINSQFGIYLNDLLFEVYDEYCSDNEIQSLEHYLDSSGVDVDVDDLPGVKYQLKLKAFPLRFEMENQHLGNQEVVWKAA